jgi:heterodisulfide reductase subunit B2
VNAKFKTKYNIPVLYITQLIGLALGIDAEKLGLNTCIVSPRAVLDRIKKKAAV